MILAQGLWIVCRERSFNGITTEGGITISETRGISVARYRRGGAIETNYDKSCLSKIGFP